MTDREKREIIKAAATWRGIAKRSADLLERLKFFSALLAEGLEPLKQVPVIHDLYGMALRWDCRIGDYLDELRAEIAAATQDARPPARLTPLPV
jgi:hypothetical protein